MIYLENSTSGQTIFIPRNDSLGSIHKGSYEQGFEDGYESGETHQKNLLSSVTFTENGEYERENGWSAVTVDVPQTGSTARLEEKTVVISDDTTNVTPSSGYDGMSAVTVDASSYAQENYDDGFDDGFTDGYASGSTDEKAKLSAVTFTTNTAVTVSDGGYSAVTVNVPQTGTSASLEEKNVVVTATTMVVNPSQGFDGMSKVNIDAQNFADENWQSGYTQGEEDQKNRLTTTAFTENGSYTRANGWSGVTVNIDTASTWNSGYTSGYTDAFDEIEANEQTLSVSANGTYQTGLRTEGYLWNEVIVNVPQTGSSLPLSSITITGNTAITVNDKAYSAITVNVPQTGHTDQELEDAYTSGHTDGMNDQKELLSSTALTINGDYTNVNGWSAVTVDVSGSTPALESKNYSLYNDGFDPTFGDVISPSSGYDGLSQVTITDDGYSQAKYLEGYYDGQGSMAGEYQRGWDDGFGAGSNQGFIGGVDSTVYGAYYPIESQRPSNVYNSYKTQITQFSGVGTTFEFHFTNLIDTSWPYGMLINGFADNFYLKYESTESADTKAYIIYVSDGNGNSNTLTLLTRGSNNVVGYLTITQEGCEYGLGSGGIITSTASTSGDFASVLFSILFNPETKYNIVFNRMRVIANGTVQKEFIYQNGDIVDVVNNATTTTYDYSGNTVTGVFQPRLVSYPSKVLNS